jgi:hypothetical protein
MSFDCYKNQVIANYLSNGATNDPIRDAQGEIVSPYVKVFFENLDEPVVTVGNNSTPGAADWEQAAIVKSFELGVSNGAGCKIEIFDQQSSSLSFFVQKIARCINTTTSDFKMKVEWGWIVGSCNQVGPPQTIKTRGLVTFLIANIESVIAEGRVKFIISGTDVMQHVFASRNFQIFGDEDKPIPLTQAIMLLATESEPKFQVGFYAYQKDVGFVPPIKWKDAGEQGPIAVWPSDGQNKLNTIAQWVEPFVTENNKGVIFAWDTQSPFPKLNILEDPTPNGSETGSGDSNIIARYIVGGGACSSVLSFTPNVNWVAAMSALNSGGNSGGAATGASEQKDEARNGNIQGGNTDVGTAQSITVARYAEYFYGPKNVVKKTKEAQDANKKANDMVIPVQAAVKAQLRLQGDPRTEYIHSRFWYGKYIALAVLNPFYISGNANSNAETNQNCGDWTAKPLCNEVYSNKRWKISGINHSIREGSYVTTLDLWLPVSGIDLPDDTLLGGNDSGSTFQLPSCN